MAAPNSGGVEGLRSLLRHTFDRKLSNANGSFTSTYNAIEFFKLALPADRLKDIRNKNDMHRAIRFTMGLYHTDRFEVYRNGQAACFSDDCTQKAIKFAYAPIGDMKNVFDASVFVSKLISSATDIELIETAQRPQPRGPAQPQPQPNGPNGPRGPRGPAHEDEWTRARREHEEEAAERRDDTYRQQEDEYNAWRQSNRDEANARAEAKRAEKERADQARADMEAKEAKERARQRQMDEQERQKRKEEYAREQALKQQRDMEAMEARRKLEARIKEREAEREAERLREQDPEFIQKQKERNNADYQAHAKQQRNRQRAAIASALKHLDMPSINDIINKRKNQRSRFYEATRSVGRRDVRFEFSNDRTTRQRSGPTTLSIPVIL